MVVVVTRIQLKHRVDPPGLIEGLDLFRVLPHAPQNGVSGFALLVSQGEVHVVWLALRFVGEDIVTYFREFYEARRAAGLVVEKANSIYAKGGYTDAQAQRNILSNPFKRLEDMQMLHHAKTLGVIQVDESVWKKLTREEKQEIERICDEKLERYFLSLK